MVRPIPVEHQREFVVIIPVPASGPTRTAFLLLDGAPLYGRQIRPRGPRTHLMEPLAE